MAGLNESPELIAQEFGHDRRLAVELRASMKVLSLLLRNLVVVVADGGHSPPASMKVLSLLLRNISTPMGRLRTAWPQ